MRNTYTRASVCQCCWPLFLSRWAPPNALTIRDLPVSRALPLARPRSYSGRPIDEVCSNRGRLLIYIGIVQPRPEKSAA